MGKIISGFLIIGLLLVIGVYGSGHFGPEFVDEQKVIDIGMEKVKASTKLNEEQEQLLRVQLAVNDYMINNGTAPDDLSVLVGSYFDELPVNPRTGEKFQYRRDENNIPRLGEEVSIEATQLAMNTLALGTTEASNEAVDEMLEIEDMKLFEDREYVYDPSDKRDPFREFDLSKKNVSDNLSPLERFEVIQLRLTAVLEDTMGEPTAIVEDATGRGYTVRTGTKIGNSGGVVAVIEADRIKIVSTVIDFTGKESRNVEEMPITSKSAPQPLKGSKIRKKR